MCATNAEGAIKRPETWADIRLRYIIVKVEDDATDARGLEDTSLPAVDW